MHAHAVDCADVFNHRNESLRPWLIHTMFLGNATGGGNPAVDGFYVDDGWSAKGPSEMDKDSVAKMGMSVADVKAMITAWSANVAACEQQIEQTEQIPACLPAPCRAAPKYQYSISILDLTLRLLSNRTGVCCLATGRQAIYEAGLFEWFMVYGGQQTAPGWSQTAPNSTCLKFMRTNCGKDSPSQNGASQPNDRNQIRCWEDDMSVSACQSLDSFTVW